MPATAVTDLDVERITQACSAVEPNAYYSIRHPRVLLKELDRNPVGIGAFGFSVNFSIPYRPDTRVGVQQNEKQQLTASKQWNAEAGAFEDGFILHTGSAPIADNAVLVDVRSENGAVGMARVHACTLLHDHYVQFANAEGDVSFEVTKIVQEERKLDVLVDGAATPPDNSETCGGAQGAGVLLLPGERAKIISTGGEVSFGTFDARKFGPEGIPDKWQSYRYGDLADINHGALAYSAFGHAGAARPGTIVEAQEPGCLALFVNDTDPANNEGSFEASIKVMETL